MVYAIYSAETVDACVADRIFAFRLVEGRQHAVVPACRSDHLSNAGPQVQPSSQAWCYECLERERERERERGSGMFWGFGSSVTDAV